MCTIKIFNSTKPRAFTEDGVKPLGSGRERPGSDF